MTRRNFFTMLGGLAAALGFKPAARAIEPVSAPVPQQIATSYLDPHVGAAWGPGVKHPHWRVPQGRWVVDEPKPIRFNPDFAVQGKIIPAQQNWPTPDLLEAQRTLQPLENSPWCELKAGQLNPPPRAVQPKP